MASEEFPDGAVVPLGHGGDPGSDPWMMLSTQRGVLVGWTPSAHEKCAGWGPQLGGTSQLAKQLTSIALRAGASPEILNGPALFTLELPTGSTLRNLVPAIGGGFRGMVRAGGSITGHARLVPLPGAGVGAGAGIAMGPLVALVALAVGAEMLARHQQDKKLNLIYEGIERLEHTDQERTAAQLRAASEALELGRAALVDHVSIPNSIGLGTARNNLRDIRNRATGWLEAWEEGVKGLPDSGDVHVPLATMDRLVSGRSGSVDTFPERVATLFHALCLDSRATLITSVESALENPDVELQNMEKELQSALKQNAETQERLREVLWRLAERPVYTPYLTSTGSTEAKAYRLTRSLSRLAEMAARTPDALGVLTDSGRQVLQLTRSGDGSLKILEPAGAPAAA